MTAVNLDQELGLIVAPGAPAVAEDQSLALIVEQRLVPKIIYNYTDQLLALIITKRLIDLVQLIGGGYQDFLGNPLAFGYLKMNISNPVEIYTVGTEVIEGSDIHFRINLDGNGNVISNPPQNVLSTSSLKPACTYTVTAYKADGTTASAPQIVTVPNTSAQYNIALSVPNWPSFS
jgi:hypothetical protein